MDVIRDIWILFNILILKNMKILVKMFEGPISYNKESRNITTSPWNAPGKNVFDTENKDLFPLPRP